MTTEDTFREWVPLAALDALDGPDRVVFDTHRRGCAECDRELRDDRAITRRLHLTLARVIPSPALKRRVLEAVAAEAPREVPESTGLGRPSARWTTLRAALPVAAALVLGFGLVGALEERHALVESERLSRAEAEAARQGAQSLTIRVRTLEAELTAARERLATEASFRELVAHSDSRVASLAGAVAGSTARARVVWNPSSRAAVLLVSGLARAPEGQAYEVWVIAKGAPVPAGLFQVDDEGRAQFTLPTVEETARVKTFAVTLEPAEGRSAPSGPLVLAGTVS